MLPRVATTGEIADATSRRPTVRSGPMTQRGLIVGGGIGGLTAAVALRSQGVECIILERAPELRELGVGIALWPNAVKVLRRLGIGEDVEAVATAQHVVSVRTWRGDGLAQVAFGGAEAQFGAPLLVLHRAALQAALCRALDPGVLELGRECVDVEQDAEEAIVTFSDGHSERADFAIGADGLESRVRVMAFGEDTRRYSGYTAWRGIVSLDEALARRIQPAESWGRGSVFGINPLAG